MKRCLLALLGCLALTSHVIALAKEPAAAGRVSLPTDVVPSHYDLDIELDHAVDRFSGTVKITIQVSRPTSREVTGLDQWLQTAAVEEVSRGN